VLVFKFAALQPDCGVGFVEITEAFDAYIVLVDSLAAADVRRTFISCACGYVTCHY
jgi:hypothetical protein